MDPKEWGEGEGRRNQGRRKEKSWVRDPREEGRKGRGRICRHGWEGGERHPRRVERGEDASKTWPTHRFCATTTILVRAVTFLLVPVVWAWSYQHKGALYQ